jgi:dipeptidyl aminopeptidase/acylaminoacyl peptidase
LRAARPIALVLIAAVFGGCILLRGHRQASAAGGPRDGRRGEAPAGGGLGRTGQFLVGEMRADGVSEELIRRYERQIREALKAKDKERVRSLVSEAIREAYGIEYWKPVTWKSTDGLTVYGYLTTPDSKRKRGSPGLVFLHGADHGSAMIYRKHAFLYAKEGYASLAVDYRSSVGHGDRLAKADDLNPGGKEFDDVLTGIQFLKGQSAVDASRIGVFGGSRGAYIGGWVIEQVRVQAAVLNFGAYDTVGLAHSSFADPEEYADLEKALAAQGQSDVDGFLASRSPYKYAGKVTAPVLLIHGKDDKVVPFQETIKFSDALEKAGKDRELKLYEGAGHGFIFKDSPQSKDAFDRAMRFLNEHLK